MVARRQRNSTLIRSSVGNMVEKDWFTIFGKKYIVDDIDSSDGSSSITLHLDGDVDRVIHIVVDTDTKVAFMRPIMTGE